MLAISSLSRDAVMLLADLGTAVVQHHDITLDHACAEADDRAVAPHLGADRLARIDRRGKSYRHRLEAAGIVTAHGLENGVPRHAESRKPVQDRAGEPGS